MVVADCPIPPPAALWLSPCLDTELTCALPDLDQDGDVDINDFLDLLALWGKADCQVRKRGDINMDDEVGISDMLILLEAFGTYDPATWERCDCGLPPPEDP